MRNLGILRRATHTVTGARRNLILEIVPVPAARRAKIFVGPVSIDFLTIQLIGPNFQCTLVGHGGRNDTTGSKGRDNCCVACSDRSIAANTRTVRRARPPRVASVRQDPNSVAPGVLFCCTNLIIRAQRCAYFSLSGVSIGRAFQSVAPTNLKPSSQRRTRPVEGAGKWVAHMIVGSSQKRSNTLRRVLPACGES